VQPVEPTTQPRRNGRTATLGEPQHLWKAGYRQDAGHYARANTGRDATVAIAQEHIRIKEKLGNGAVRTRIDLALQILQIRLDAVAGFRMALRIGGNRYLQARAVLQSAHQVRGVRETARVR